MVEVIRSEQKNRINMILKWFRNGIVAILFGLLFYIVYGFGDTVLQIPTTFEEKTLGKGVSLPSVTVCSYTPTKVWVAVELKWAKHFFLK